MERLNAHDLSMVWPDDVGWPQDIGALAILDGTGLFDPQGRFRIDAIQAAIEARLHLVPRFRQLLYWPGRGLGWPLWIDAHSFDISDHVQALPVPAPGDETQLLRTTERLRRRRLNRSRPLWEMWFLTGLPAERIGFYLKVHHTIADGAAGVATLGAFLDAVPDAPAVPPQPWKPAPVPSAAELFHDNMRQRMHGAGRAVSAIARPRTTARQLREGWPAVRETLADTRAPRTSLNRPIGPDRRLALVRSSIEMVKQIGHRHDATVNDVLMTVLASGLRDLLLGRGEDVDELVLRAYVPVSLHPKQRGAARGNRDGVMAIPLPVGESDPGRRLHLIAAETAERKKRKRPAGGTLLRNGLAQKVFLHLMARQRWANIYVANVPGPPTPLYLAGAPLSEIYPIVPLTGNIALGVGALSYAGQFNLTAVADRDAIPDVDVFAAGMRDALQTLAASAGLTPAASKL
ncbi:MAG TPA: wax ester/triacylglycerol synthase family O-acyltransferase [Jiangellaceae bacterium]